jgi:hypothetical protein
MFFLCGIDGIFFQQSHRLIAADQFSSAFMNDFDYMTAQLAFKNL